MNSYVVYALLGLSFIALYGCNRLNGFDERYASQGLRQELNHENEVMMDDDTEAEMLKRGFWDKRGFGNKRKMLAKHYVFRNPSRYFGALPLAQLAPYLYPLSQSDPDMSRGDDLSKLKRGFWDKRG